MIQLKVSYLRMIPIHYQQSVLGFGEGKGLTHIQTMLNVIDNSGAAVAECVQVLKMKRHAKIGTYTPQNTT